MPESTWSTWPTACVCQLVRAPGVNVTFEARMREGASGANTSSCSTVPVKLAAGACLVGRAAARTILECIFISLVWSALFCQTHEVWTSRARIPGREPLRQSQQRLGALYHGHVDHFTLEGDRTDAALHGLIVGGDHAPCLSGGLR